MVTVLRVVAHKYIRGARGIRWIGPNLAFLERRAVEMQRDCRRGCAWVFHLVETFGVVDV